jgi:hypothetical protein
LVAFWSSWLCGIFLKSHRQWSEEPSRPTNFGAVLLKERKIMAQNTIRTGNYFLVGLGIGSLIGVLVAPKSGAETREYIAKKTRARK